MRDIDCEIVIVTPVSQCSDRELETNPKAYCITWESNKELHLIFGLKCRFSAGNTTTNEPNVCTFWYLFPISFFYQGYSRNDSKLISDDVEVLDAGDVVLSLSNNTAFDVSVNVINFNRMTNNTLDYLEENHTFCCENLVCYILLVFHSQSYTFTSRLTMLLHTRIFQHLQ